YSGKEESHVERILIRLGSERIEIRSTVFVAGVIHSAPAQILPARLFRTTFTTEGVSAAINQRIVGDIPPR
ncbi:MAG: hypothetical protein L0Z62_38260, partial [Gemmataceae bacterium]|nr:hypothetical protein [Gemmataceae bacterium]